MSNEADLELLSAYIDGELPDSDRAALEERLTWDSTLRAELASLRQTVSLLHDLPQLRSPRDLTLNPAIYGGRRAWWQRHLQSPALLQVSGALGAAASLILIAAALLSSDPAKQESAMVASPRDEVAMQATSEAPMDIPATGTIAPTTSLFAAEGTTRRSETPTPPPAEVLDSSMLATGIIEPTALAGIPAPAGEIQLFGAETAQQADTLLEEPPMPGAAAFPTGPSASTQSTGDSSLAADSGMFLDTPAAALEMQAAAPPDATFADESESAERDEETATDTSDNASAASAAGAAAADASAATEAPAQKEALSSPTAAPLPSASLKEPANEFHDDDRDWRWLAPVGLVTLLLSLSVAWLGWKWSRR